MTSISDCIDASDFMLVIPEFMMNILIMISDEYSSAEACILRVEMGILGNDLSSCQKLLAAQYFVCVPVPQEPSFDLILGCVVSDPDFRSFK